MSSCQNKITLREVKKSFNDLVVLENISLKVDLGEVISILGPSGCGKSTIFNILTNILKEDEGHKEVCGELSYMYQKDMMVPWKKVIDNIAIPLVLKGKGKKEARKIVEEYLELFGLKGFEEKYPSMLSGGMKQRANFLQTYLTSKDIMLLDEPFGALDSLTRSHMQQWLLEVKKEMKATILLVTHDIEEAVLLSDRIYVISTKPSRIMGEVKVNLPKERNEELKLTEEFLEVKREVVNLFTKNHN